MFNSQFSSESDGKVVVQFEIQAPLLGQEGWREAPGW